MTDAVCGRRSAVVLGISPRIGLSKEAHRLLRLFEKDNPWVSGPQKLTQ